MFSLKRLWLALRAQRPSRTVRQLSRPQARLVVEALENRSLLNGDPGTGLVDFGALAVDATSFDRSRILVQFRAGSHLPDSCLEGTQVATELGVVPGLHEVTLAPGVSVEQALSAYRADSRVADAQPDYRIRTTAVATPNDTHFSNLWGMHNTGQWSGTADADIDAPEAWSVTRGTGKMIVAVVDTGIDYSHPDLAANIWTNTREVNGNGRDDDGNGLVDDIHGYDFANNDGDPTDDHGHGTHVAGTIGAVGSNHAGVTGVIPNVQLMALKFMDASGKGYTSNAIKALAYAVDHGAKISNHSWGSSTADRLLGKAIDYAREKGHIVVAAAGNAAADNDRTAVYPASFDSDNVVTVAATDRYDQLASFSNYGRTTVDVAAPGSRILSTTPNNSYALYSGTSMATPHVTGTLALVWDAHPTWGYRQVIDQVLGTVDRLSALDGKTVAGGRINANSALTTVLASNVTRASVSSATRTVGISSVRTLDAEQPILPAPGAIPANPAPTPASQPSVGVNRPEPLPTPSVSVLDALTLAQLDRFFGSGLTFSSKQHGW